MAGCGGGDGISDDAVFTAYVEAPLCAEAERELAQRGAGVEHFRVRIACLPRTQKNKFFDLSQIGSNARRATEDSSSIAYVAEPGKGANAFSLPILEEADIPQLTATSGATAISRLLLAIEEAGDAGSLREAVSEALDKGLSR